MGFEERKVQATRSINIIFVNRSFSGFILKKQIKPEIRFEVTLFCILIGMISHQAIIMQVIPITNKIFSYKSVPGSLFLNTQNSLNKKSVESVQWFPILVIVIYL